MSGPPAFMQRTDSPLGFRIICDAQNGPMVAFVDLCLPYGACAYLSALDYEQHFGTTAPFVSDPKISTHLKQYHSASELSFNVDGWASSPDNSRLAKARFKYLAQPFFPEMSGRSQMLDGLSQRFTEFAAAIDRRRLTFTLRAIGPMIENYVHFDPNDYTAIANLRGDSTHHVQYTDALINEMPKWDHDPESINHRLPRKHYHLMQATSGQTLSAWRGKGTGRPSLHGRINKIKDLRVICIASVFNDDEGMCRADRHPPDALQKINDQRNSRHFCHTDYS